VGIDMDKYEMSLGWTRERMQGMDRMREGGTGIGLTTDESRSYSLVMPLPTR
jgi:hypothetical protein